MEFISGDSLDNLLKSGRQFTIIEKLEIIRQLCVGLGYAHQKGVIHRDVKPANIMVQPDGNIKIVDFGIARLGETRGHTQTGLVIGTLDYISPERLLGKPADGRADIWSAGVILYRLLAGRLPFLFPEGDSAALHRVIREPQEPLSNFLADYPPALDNVIDTALAKSPSDRYETAEDMATDLEAINEGLKRDHVAQALGNVQALVAQEQWTGVLPLLLELQRISPKNIEVKQLLRTVQDKLKRQQKTVQLREFLSGAEEAVLSQRYADAIEIYNRALDIDPGNPDLLEKIEHVRQLKEKTDKVAMLLDQSREARKRNDLTAANQLIERALQLDERNTDLRNERARILQAAEKADRERKLHQFIETAKNQLAARQYAEAIQSLRSALEIDPTDAETQRLFQEAVEREEEQRRRKVIGQIVAEISESIASEDFARALTLLQRAQERLPGEAVLLQLKADADAGYRAQSAKKLIEQTTLQVYNLFQTDPQEALAIVQQALQQMPGEPQLLALQAKVTEQIKKGNAQEQKSASLKRAQAAMDARQFEQAVQILQNAAIVCGEDPEIASMLAFAQKQKRSIELSQAVDNVTREARALMDAGDFERAIALLQPIASETRDASVEQLLRQASSSLAELARQTEALVSRAKATSESVGGLEEAIHMLQKQLEATPKSAPAKELLATLLAKREQQQETGKKIKAAREAAQRKDFSSALKDLHAVQLAFGESAELTVAIQEVEAERSSHAQEIVGQSIKSAQAALLNGNSQAAIEALKGSTPWIEFTDAKTQADWQRIGQSVKKDRETGTTATRGAVFDAELSAIASAKPKKFPVALVAVAVVALIAIVATFVWKVRTPPTTTPSESKIRIKITNAPTPPGTTVKIGDGAPQTIPASGELTLTVQPGMLHILVSAPGFDDYPDTVSVDRGVAATEPVLMTKSIPVGADTGTFSPSPQPDLQKVRVYVNGELRGEKQAGQEIRLPVGTYKVKYAWPGYLESKERQVVIAKGVNFPDSFILVEAPKTPTTGPLTVRSTPNAQVSVDGTVVGSIEPSGSLTIASVPQGSRQIHIAPPANSNLLASDQTVDVVAGKDNNVTISLKETPKLAPATVASFTADPTDIKPGDAAILSWKVTDATSISIDPNVDTGGQFLGSRSVKPSKNQTYTLTAIGKDGQPVKGTVNVTVSAAPPPPPPPPPHADTLPDEKTLELALNPYKDVFKQASFKSTKECQATFNGKYQGKLKDWAGICDSVKSYDVSIQSCQVGGSPDSPTLACAQTITIHPKSGDPSPTPSRKTFHFTKASDGGWQLSGW
jgi:tetratricopeptide (TPR) repeat protein